MEPGPSVAGGCRGSGFLSRVWMVFSPPSCLPLFLLVCVSLRVRVCLCVNRLLLYPPAVCLFLLFFSITFMIVLHTRVTFQLVLSFSSSVHVFHPLVPCLCVSLLLPLFLLSRCMLLIFCCCLFFFENEVLKFTFLGVSLLWCASLPGLKFRKYNLR